MEIKIAATWFEKTFIIVIFIIYTLLAIWAGSSIPWHLASYTNRPTVEKYWDDQADNGYSKQIKEAIKDKKGDKKK